MGAIIFFNTSMGFKMLVQIAHLAERRAAIFICAFVWLLLCMDSQMCKELAHTLNNSVTFSYSIFIGVVALKQSILHFQVVVFLDVIEGELITVGNMIGEAEESWVEIFARNYRHLIIRSNLVLLHETLR